jgi:hypothetical protein
MWQVKFKGSPRSSWSRGEQRNATYATWTVVRKQNNGDGVTGILILKNRRMGLGCGSTVEWLPNMSASLPKKRSGDPFLVVCVPTMVGFVMTAIVSSEGPSGPSLGLLSTAVGGQGV